jgi:glycerophosphoryl diester phosphodiesterase
LPDYQLGWLVHEKQRLLRHTPGWRWLGVTALHPEHRLITRAWLHKQKALGAIVNAWTVNDAERAAELAALGVDAIITDQPALIVGAL